MSRRLFFLQILVITRDVRIYSSSLDKHFVSKKLKCRLVWGINFGLSSVLR